MGTPSPPADPTSAVVHAFRVGLLQVASQHPLFIVVFAAVALGAACRSARMIIHTGPRDRQRLFIRTDKRALLALAGDRCEHHGWLTGRCTETERLEADHVHPWSRGGWTNIRNGQILCRRHNRAKLASVPWNRSLRRLAERRASYYPLGVDPAVVRRPTQRRRNNSDMTLRVRTRR